MTPDKGVCVGVGVRVDNFRVRAGDLKNQARSRWFCFLAPPPGLQGEEDWILSY